MNKFFLSKNFTFLLLLGTLFILSAFFLSWKQAALYAQAKDSFISAGFTSSYSSEFFIKNGATQEQTFTLTFTSTAGEKLTPLTETISPGDQRNFSLPHNSSSVNITGSLLPDTPLTLKKQ